MARPRAALARGTAESAGRVSRMGAGSVLSEGAAHLNRRHGPCEMLKRSLVHPVDFDFGGGAKMDGKLFLANPRNVALVNGQTKNLAQERWSGMEVLGLVIGIVVWSSIAVRFSPRAYANVKLSTAEVSTAKARVVHVWTESGDDVTYYLSYEFLIEPGEGKVTAQAPVALPF